MLLSLATSLVRVAWPALMAKLYICPNIPCFFGPFHSIHSFQLIQLTYFTDLQVLSISNMGNEANKAAGAANDLNPNGFTTDREVDGERRSIRHYNDGRVSGRGRSIEDSRQVSRKNSTGTGGRARPPTSHPRDLGDRSTPAASGPSDVADITAAMAKLTVDHPTSPKVKRLSKKLNLDADPGIETVTLRKVNLSPTPSVISSTCSKGTNSSVNARIAEIEDRVRKHIKSRLQSIQEEDEE
ncbi:unnamed protein product [Penicillium nalgiovense]|uniref:Uncharacterized protein n=2 Tax=Penicillium nalgiovense TaxID=60175 RepID=A0A9W4NBR4_PENNA|nr:unnamed protein product [Penicillium nalgiovense]CAG7937389.1 unnamed protein product [Penicillium nalgiovense]CAG7956730.1 unnamed protein product [Penicillium nalgiovense]CAG7984491.1 unnamed protein product [Penicillium nalgiovense]CAG7984647.1 unnamed protein product [Penicillium nalgiovense]